VATISAKEIPYQKVPNQKHNDFISIGTADYRRSGLALFLAGFSSFSLIYCVQPLLPIFSREYGISATYSSLALSYTTGVLAFAIVLASAFSQALGRKGLMFTSMLATSALCIASIFIHDWNVFLAIRAVEGILLGGVPAVAMAWLSEEIDPAHLGKSMGLYVSGTAFGAMMGRIGIGVLTEYVSWRSALGILGVLCFISSIGFWYLLPASRHFERNPGMNVRYHLSKWWLHLSTPKLLCLYLIAFLLPSVFTTLFNYSTFHLSEPPYGLTPFQSSLLFLAFAFGMVSSTVSGVLADKMGRVKMIQLGFACLLAGSLTSLFAPLMYLVIGISMVTIGFFIGHSAASGAVGRSASQAKGHATSLYLLFYYLGNSVTGTLGGWFWHLGEWQAVVLLTSVIALVGAIFSLFLKETSD
jgi:YNFM family putative membrane transporter